LAAILADRADNVAGSSRQLPFVVTDQGDTWLVRGSYNVDRSVEGPGPFRLEVRKRDAAVLDMCFEMVLHTPVKAQDALPENGR
jgi:hypothetical protein